MKLGDYFTKHHIKTHNQSMRKPTLMNTIIEVQERILGWCDKTRNLGYEENED